MKRGCIGAGIVGIIIALLLVVPGNAWSMNLDVETVSNEATLTFGIEPQAEDMYDPSDIPIPPSPPDASLDAYFISDGIFNRLVEDYRETAHWDLYIRSNEDIQLSWEKPPETLYIYYDNTSINMNQLSGTELETGEYHIVITNETHEEYSSSGETIATPATETTQQSIPQNSEPTKTPGFAVISGIIGLIAISILKRL